jgi:plasmid stability protein
MATLTLKNVPDSLYARLKLAAARNRRSLNQEAIAQLEQTLWTRTPDENERAAEQVRAFRKTLEGRVWLTEEDVDRFINEGRE